MTQEYIQIQCTAESVGQARQILKALLDEKLIACGSIMPLVESLYNWQGEIEQTQEVKIWMKSHNRHFKEIEKRILAIHSYEVPEILVFEVLKGNIHYMKWISQSLCK